MAVMLSTRWWALRARWANTKWKVAPWFGAAFAQIWPPWRASTRRTLARPMAAAGVFAGLVQALEHAEQLGRISHVETGAVVAHAEMVAAVGLQPVVDPTSISSTSRLALYLTALPSRFSHSWRIMFSSATRIGSGAMLHSMRWPLPA